MGFCAAAVKWLIGSSISANMNIQGNAALVIMLRILRWQIEITVPDANQGVVFLKSCSDLANELINVRFCILFDP